MLVSLIFVLWAPVWLRAQDAGKPKKVEKPCEGAVAHVHHAYSKCIGGVWHVVTEVEYECPNGSREMVESSQPTGQKCDAGKPFDLIGHLRGKGPCTTPKPAGELVVRKCVQGFWETETYSRYECGDGTIVIIGGPIRSDRTNEPCEERVSLQKEPVREFRKDDNPKPQPSSPPSSVEHSTGGTTPPPQKLPRTSAPPPPPPPPAPKETAPPPTSAPTSSASNYMCNKTPCDCAKATPKKVCKAGSGCACTKG
jgi:hypothetical protein